MAQDLLERNYLKQLHLLKEAGWELNEGKLINKESRKKF